MLHRRSTAIPAPLLPARLVIVLAVLVGALSACGFDYPTDRVNQIAAGDNNRDASVDVLGVRILATSDGHGRLIGALVNNTPDDASLDAVTDASGAVTADFEPIDVPGDGHLNLATDADIAVTGDFAAGDVVPLTFELSTPEQSTETVTLNVPVVKRCFQYTAVPEPSGSTESPTDVATESPTDEATAEETETESTPESTEHATGEHESTESGDPAYTCASGHAELGGGEH